jgi:hypothetical protein
MLIAFARVRYVANGSKAPFGKPASYFRSTADKRTIFRARPDFASGHNCGQWRSDAALVRYHVCAITSFQNRKRTPIVGSMLLCCKKPKPNPPCTWLNMMPK